MKHARKSSGFTIVELLAVVLAVTLLLAAILPSLARAQGSSGIQQSMGNLVTLGVAHVLYALDFDGRQVTWVRDDLGVYEGDVQLYNIEVCGGCTGLCPPPCQPALVAGHGCSGNVWAWWPGLSNRPMIQPINFPGPPNNVSFADGIGHFRAPNAKSFHDYVNGRYHDPVFYAPDDTLVLSAVADCLDKPCEYVAGEPYEDLWSCNPGFASYALSPATMFHPDAWRSNAAGGWQAPWELDHGYEAPGLFQATYPDLKTLMIEHSWVQDPPADCNPISPGCSEPYYFNQGIDSTPVTLFYDGSVRLLANTEVFAADQQVLKSTGGVDGLWHRGTPLGEDGYFISRGYDGTPLSHHVLTTDGILGRDTLGGVPPWPRPGRQLAGQRKKSFHAADTAVLTVDSELFTFTQGAGDDP